MVDVTSTAAPPLAARKPERLPVFRTIGGMFQTFGGAPITFIGLALVAVIPSLVRVALFGPASTMKLTVAGVLASGLPGLLLLVFNYAAFSFLAVRLREGAKPPLGETLRVAVRRYLPILAVTILSVLAFYVGLILLVVPGLIAVAAFAVGFPVCVVEPLGPIESLRRSAALTRGSRWRILGIYLIVFIPIIGLGVAGTFLLARHGHTMIFFVVNTVSSLFTQPLLTILGAEMYLGLRRLKETIGVASVFD